MSKKDKIIKDLENNPKNARLETLIKLLENAGYTTFNKGSSHYQFRKNGKQLITIPRHRPIKEVYVKIVLKAIKEI